MTDDLCPECGKTIAECNRITLLRLAAESLAPLTVDHAGYIWGRSKKGGKTVIANVRGWGYLTGKGAGALGLTEAEGIDIQREWGEMICEAVNELAHARKKQNAKRSDKAERE